MTAVSCICTDGMQLSLIISVRVVTSLNTSVHKMVSPSICVGCGLDVSNASRRRSDACQHVYVLWATLFDEQLVGTKGVGDGTTSEARALPLFVSSKSKSVFR